MKVSPNSLRIGIAVFIILGTIGWLAYSGYGSSKSYYVTISELGGMGDKAYHSNFRVEGFVQPGSIEQNGTHVDFVLNEYESHSAQGRNRPPAQGQLQGLRAAARHLQGRFPGAGRRHLRPRWRLPRHRAAGQVRQQVRPCAARRRAAPAQLPAKPQFAPPPPLPHPPTQTASN